MKVERSCVYATIKTLEKKQNITGKVQKDGNMPDKTIYSITEQGTAVLLDTLRTSFLKFDYDTNIFSITAFFLDFLPLEEQKALLEKRMIVLSGILPSFCTLPVIYCFFSKVLIVAYTVEVPILNQYLIFM